MSINLLILPFDHRSSFSKKILGIESTPNQEQIQKIKDLKSLIYRAFLRVWEGDEIPDELGILVDEEYGAEIIRDANEKGINTASGVEKSGQDVFTFEYGRKFGKHIENLNPDYVKVLIRYHPENKRGNRKQISRLAKLSKFCEKTGRPLLLELLVPPTEEERNGEKNFDTKIRPLKTAEAIKELKGKVNVAIWKLEGFTPEGWKPVLKAVPEENKIIVLGRGANAAKVEYWLKNAAQFEQIIGFAVGRTIFMEPLLKLLGKEISEEETINSISANYKHFVDLWRASR